MRTRDDHLPTEKNDATTKNSVDSEGLRVYVKDESGNVTNWNMELASPNALRRLGWTREILKVGDEVTVFGAPAKDGTKMANARTVTLADGRKMVAGLAEKDSEQ